MGEKFLIQGGNKTKMTQMKIPLGKYSMLGEAQGVQVAEVKNIGNSMGIDWNTITLDELYEGVKEEMEEHGDVIGNDVTRGVQIAYAHLKKISDYYTRLRAMENEATIPNTDDNIKNAMVKGGANSGRYPKGSGEANSSVERTKDSKEIVENTKDLNAYNRKRDAYIMIQGPERIKMVEDYIGAGKPFPSLFSSLGRDFSKDELRGIVNEVKAKGQDAIPPEKILRADYERQEQFWSGAKSTEKSNEFDETGLKLKDESPKTNSDLTDFANSIVQAAKASAGKGEEPSLLLGEVHSAIENLAEKNKSFGNKWNGTREAARGETAWHEDIRNVVINYIKSKGIKVDDTI